MIRRPRYTVAGDARRTSAETVVVVRRRDAKTGAVVVEERRIAKPGRERSN